MAELKVSISPDAKQIDAMTAAVENLAKVCDEINASGEIDLTINFNSTFDAPREQIQRQELIDAIQAVNYADNVSGDIIANLAATLPRLYVAARAIAGDYIDQTPAGVDERDPQA